MTRIVLPGLNGANPLGFLAAVGLLRILRVESRDARLGFLDDGSCQAFVDGFSGDVADAVVRDAAAAAEAPPWMLTYEKQEKKGTKVAADLKPEPKVFEAFTRDRLAQWRGGNGEGAAYAAAYATSVAVDGKGNTKPTAFHFTAANQEFLKAVDGSRGALDIEWVRESLCTGHASRPGSNLRWDPAAERNYALRAENPTTDGTSVDAPLEWLAFRGLSLFPSFPKDANPRPRIITTGVSGRGDDMEFSWALWRVPASLAAVRSLVHVDWSKEKDRDAQGVFAVCTSAIRRTSQGFGNFGPAAVES